MINCSVVPAKLIVIWSMKYGMFNNLTGFEVIPAQVQKCKVHNQDFVNCSLGHRPVKWDGDFHKE